jgi:hypothetical protein
MTVHRTCLFTAFFVLAGVGSARAGSIVLFNNFGPNDNYLGGQSGWLVSGPQSGPIVSGFFAPADAFTPTQTAAVFSVKAALGYVSGAVNDVKLEIRADANGLPGAVLDTLDFPMLPAAETNAPPVTALSTQHPVLQAGTQYWLQAFAAGDTVDVISLNNTNDVGLHANSNTGGDSYYQVFNTNERGAFAVIGATSVPEPTTVMLPLLATAGLALRSWRRRVTA